MYDHIHIQREKTSLISKIQFIRQVSYGMGYLHSRDIVHKRLTTRNIFLCPNVRISVVDYGLAEVKYDRCVSRLPNRNFSGRLGKAREVAIRPEEQRLPLTVFSTLISGCQSTSIQWKSHCLRICNFVINDLINTIRLLNQYLVQQILHFNEHKTLWINSVTKAMIGMKIGIKQILIKQHYYYSFRCMHAIFILLFLIQCHL